MKFAIRLFKENGPVVWGPFPFEGDLEAAYDFVDLQSRRLASREVFAEIRGDAGQVWVRWLGK